jgi:hypothetical protein
VTDRASQYVSIVTDRASQYISIVTDRVSQSETNVMQFLGLEWNWCLQFHSNLGAAN